MKFKSNNHAVYSCRYHVVWCPKYRRKVLQGAIAERLKELIEKKCSEINADIIEMEILPDHVHLILEVDPQFGIAKTVRYLKGGTSRIMRQEFRELTTRLPTLWTKSYLVSTVGSAPLEFIKQYIESQKRSEIRRKKRDVV